MTTPPPVITAIIIIPRHISSFHRVMNSINNKPYQQQQQKRHHHLNYKCKICNDKFDHSFQLINHHLQSHDILSSTAATTVTSGVEQISDRLKNNPHKCFQCRRRFKKEGYRDLHYRKKHRSHYINGQKEIQNTILMKTLLLKTMEDKNNLTSEICFKPHVIRHYPNKLPCKSKTCNKNHCKNKKN